MKFEDLSLEVQLVVEQFRKDQDIIAAECDSHRWGCCIGAGYFFALGIRDKSLRDAVRFCAEQEWILK